MSEGLGRSADRPKVFISYSRHDGSALAEELVPGLELAGFEAYLDIHDIEKGVDWEKRLGGLILKADSVVFIITPASVRSPRCQWEVDHAGQLAKRLIPVQWIRVDAAEVPERLRRLNYTIFAEGQSFARPLAELTSALRQDVDWIRTHTVIGEQAARWKARSERGNADDLLLRGSELDNARNWLKRRKDDAPAITELQSAFFSVSEAAEEERVRIEKQQLAERQQLISDADIAKKRWRYARITFDALFFPSRIVPLIDFNDKASLRSVILFWVAIGIISVSLNSIFISAYGIDIALGNPEGDYWMTFLAATQKIIMKHQMLGVLFSS